MLFNQAGAPRSWMNFGANLPDLDEIIDLKPLTVTPQTLASDAIAQMGQTCDSQCNLDPSSLESSLLRRSACVLVVEGSRPVGILTERDVVRLSIAGIDLSHVTIAQVMTQPIVTLTRASSHTAYSVLTLFQQHQIRHLPLVDDQGQLQGIVTRDRLCQMLHPANLLKLRQVAELMTEQVIHAAPTASIRSIAQQMVSDRKSCIVVVEPHATQPQALVPVGIITERDMVQFQRFGVNFAETQAQAVMSAPLFCLKPTDSLWLAQQEMQRRRVRRLVVAGEHGELRGMVTHTSLLRVFDPVEMASVLEIMQHQLEQQTQALNQTVQQLEQEMRERQQINASLQESQRQLQVAYDQLEQEVAERTADLVQANRLLRESEHRYMSLIEASPVGIFWFDARGQCTYVNDRWSEMTGISAAAAMGMGWLQTIHPDDRERTIRTWNHWVQIGKLEPPFQNESRIVRPDGSILWGYCLVRPDLDSNGSLIGYIGSVTDITERKRLETERQQLFTQAQIAKNQVTTILESITDGFIALDRNWCFTYVNAQAGRILQRDPAELIGKFVWSEFVNVTDTAFYREYHRAIAEQVTVEFEEFYAPLNTWFSVHAYPSADGLVAYFQDITQRKQDEQQIREQATLIDVASDAIYVRDFSNQIVFWNQGAERLYGWQREEALGRNATALLFQSEPPELIQAAKAILEAGEWQGELQKVTKSAKAVTVISRLTLVRDADGVPRSVLTVDTDITEKKQLETQFLRAQRLESIGTLASGIAHDLNNILTPVLAVAQLLPRKLPPVDASTQRLLEILEINAKRGSNLVKQVLSFARGNDGQRTSLQVGHLLTEIAKIAQQTFPKSIEIHSQVSTADLWLVRGDATQLHQVIMNLCVNARDAMPNGGTLSVAAQNCTIDATFARMHLDAQVGSYVKITIADTGTGIAPEVFDRIFDPFFTTKQQGEGTGLGLSTVLTIIKNHDGFLEVQTEVGHGTSFNVYLPASEKSEEPSSAVPEYLEGNNELILVVDDEVELGQTIKTLLEIHHYRVLMAQDGAEAIALYTQKHQEIDLVLLDLMMPALDGFKLIAMLPNVNPRVQIVAMSGSVSQQEKASASKCVQAFLAKPFTTEDLLGTIAQVLQRSSVASF